MSTFSALPHKQNARRRILHQARTGTRPSPVVPVVEDALGTLQAVGKYAQAFTAEKVNIEFFAVLADSWAARHT